jgi:uncharacterized membrane protein
MGEPLMSFCARARWAKTIFALDALCMAAAGLMDFLEVRPGAVNGLVSAAVVLSVALLAAHGSSALGLRRLLLFVGLGAATGFVFEFRGVHGGTVFGGSYSYDEARFTPFILFGVPAGVPLFWSLFIYTGYSITNGLLRWMRQERPCIRNGRWPLVPLLVVLDALAVMAFDMFMDPLLVQRGTWTWKDHGPYFGVPIGNFIGWFAVAAITAFAYRVFEYLRPPRSFIGDEDVLHLIPPLGYGLVCLLFTLHALRINMPSLALTGFCVMMPMALANLACFCLRSRPAQDPS